MKNFKWGTTSFYPEEDVYVVLFVSRNKDNSNLLNFQERRISFITTKKWDDHELQQKFQDFVEAGQPGEMSRFYYSVNSRDPAKIYKEFIHFLIDNPDFNLCYCASKLAGIAAKKECAKSKRWMFDFDSNDKDRLTVFCNDMAEYINAMEITTYKTPNGYAVVTEHGFDTRELVKLWPDVTLKRDDLLCVDWKTNLK